MAIYPTDPFSNLLPSEPAKLTVGDIERLAKAGVSIKFEDIRQQVIADYPQAMPAERPRYLPLVDAFEDRWYRNTKARDNAYRDSYASMPFEFFAATNGDKVVVLLSDGANHVVLEDPTNLYPSDDLMASIHLWLKAKA
jgi:hypothetical protein